MAIVQVHIQVQLTNITYYYHTMICTITVQFSDKDHMISIYIPQTQKKNS